MGWYSFYLKQSGILYMTLWLVAYIVKWGVLWHNAGDPFQAPTVFHPYFNMLVTIYAILGLYLFLAARNPVKSKWFLSYSMWGTEFAHGCIAFASVFQFNCDDCATGGEYWNNKNFDKL